MSLIDDIRKDREAGSGRDWKWTSKDPETGFLSQQMRWLDVGGWYAFASAPAFTVADDDGEEDYHAEAKANLDRIARVPQMEAALLDAHAALQYLSDESKFDKTVTGYAQAALAQMGDAI